MKLFATLLNLSLANKSYVAFPCTNRIFLLASGCPVILPSLSEKTMAEYDIRNMAVIQFNKLKNVGGE